MSMVDHVAVSIERLMVDLPIGAVACIPVIPQVQHARSFLTSMGVKPNASALLVELAGLLICLPPNTSRHRPTSTMYAGLMSLPRRPPVTIYDQCSDCPVWRVQLRRPRYTDYRRVVERKQG